MAVSSSRTNGLLTWTLISAAFLLVGFLGVRKFAAHLGKVVEAEASAHKRGLESDKRVAAVLPDTKTLRVWAAGHRGSSGFCTPCSMFPPPTILYETSDAGEIREFGAILRFRRTTSRPEVANCGPLTFDCVRDEEILHSFNYKASRLSEESAQQIEAWLRTREIWSKREAIIAAAASVPFKK